jgi:hypothetical protein
LQREVTCGVSYSLSVPTPTQTLRTTTYLWLAVSSPPLLRIYSAPATQPTSLKEVGVVEPGGGVAALLYVPGTDAQQQHQVWAAMEGERSIMVYAAR